MTFNDEALYTPEYELESVTFQLPHSNNHSSSSSDDEAQTIIRTNLPQVTFVVYTVVPPPLEYMSVLHDNQVEISGRKLWCGSILLSQYIVSTFYDTPRFQQQRILELGSGSGIVGMALALATRRYPPSCLVLSDGEDVTVQLMKQNIQQEENQLLLGIHQQLIHVTTLRWGERSKIWEDECCQRFSQLLSLGDDDDNSMTSTPTPTIQYDCILAGDVLYKHDLPCLFFQTVHAYLSRTNHGILLLCHIPRATVTHEYVTSVAQSYGFHIQQLDLCHIPIPSSCPLEDAQRARLYQMTLG